MTGRVFDIQRFSVHDGPGIRTTVFLKGCPLNCAWCHNPEGIRAGPELSFDREKCLACGECVRACPMAAHSLQTDGKGLAHVLDRGRCEVRGECVSVCCSDSLEIVGRSLSVEEVMREVMADRVFYRQAGGGLTISGGEPLMQAEFTAALLVAAKKEGLHCCVETSGFGGWEALCRMLPLTDLFLFDWKVTEPVEHERHTGQSNTIIARNLRELYARGARIRLQCPLIPGINDNEGHYEGIEALLESMPNLDGISILPYHPLGTAKLERLGRPPAFAASTTSAIRQSARFLAGRLARRGFRVVGTEGDRQEGGQRRAEDGVPRREGIKSDF
ncbi:MAG TPA: glycyl-radical enzyme activating protein [Verrucomicrobiae bacterium]|nr:glycyl-radical enzyme activating protein [Verrucomicrobiae bacterium]